ncbi:hypothetical protein R1flu_000822 [Riccia fluitans]|uniref:Uncharacterized protein n=1 Tax=Riccia fluitans TaxID=41844 RepID=A0ABD1Y4H3_9MARC
MNAMAPEDDIVRGRFHVVERAQGTWASQNGKDDSACMKTMWTKPQRRFNVELDPQSTKYSILHQIGKPKLTWKHEDEVKSRKHYQKPRREKRSRQEIMHRQGMTKIHEQATRPKSVKPRTM